MADDNPSVDTRRDARRGERKTRRGRPDWSLVVFIASLVLLAFLYGAVSSELKLPPSNQVRHAVAALRSLDLFEDESLVASLNRIDEKAAPAPDIRTLDPAAGNELLLVTGGPNQDAAHCPRFGCLAWVIDRSGKVLHAWPLPLDTLFKGIEGFKGDTDTRNFYPVGLGLLDDGSIVATFHARNMFPYVVGIARIGWDGRVMWKHIDGAHHWLQVGPDGRIYAPIQVRRRIDRIDGNAVDIRCPTVVYDEGVRIYRPDGTVERTLIMTDLLVRNGFPGFLYSVRDDCDPIHLNSVDVATAGEASHIPGAAAGDLLVSARELSSVMLLDPVSGRIKRVVSGRTAAQHSAQFLPDGTVLVFDNQGGSKAQGGSRIVRLNLVDGTSQVVFPTGAGKAMLPFFSPDGGTVVPSPDGRRAFVSSKDQSRTFEIDLATGKPLWTMDRVLDVGPFMGASKPVAGYFKAYGTSYVTDLQARALRLR